MAALLALGACSGSGGDSTSEGRDGAPSDPETTTTTAPPRIDLSQPIPGGSLHGTPRPPLENTGNDYIAIFESLMANFRWLTENPDVAALDAVYVPGTDTHRFQAEFFVELVANNWRSADDGYRVESVDVIDARPEAVSIRFSDTFQFERIVDASGATVGEGRPREPATKTWSVLLVPDDAGHWRAAEVTPAAGGVVEL